MAVGLLTASVTLDFQGSALSQALIPTLISVLFVVAGLGACAIRFCFGTASNLLAHKPVVRVQEANTKSNELCNDRERYLESMETRAVEERGPGADARIEADALRQASFALSRGLAMDSIFDALFECFASLVPFDTAVVLLRESEEELMVARETPNGRSKTVGRLVKASRSSYLQRILFEQRPVLIPDTTRESAWRPVVPKDRARSWIGLPLVSRGCVVGVLSLSCRTAGRFTSDHLRLSKSLAVSAALAIDHARVRESAEIYAASLRLGFRGPS